MDADFETPAVLALAVSKVINAAAFTSAAEFRAAIAALCRAGGVAAGEIESTAPTGRPRQSY